MFSKIRSSSRVLALGAIEDMAPKLVHNTKETYKLITSQKEWTLINEPKRKNSYLYTEFSMTYLLSIFKSEIFT